MAKPSGLAAALRDIPGQFYRCPLGKVIDSLDGDDRKAFDEAVAAIEAHRATFGQKASNGGPSARWLRNQLEANGYTVGLISVQEHLSTPRRCSCRG